MEIDASTLPGKKNLRQGAQTSTLMRRFPNVKPCQVMPYRVSTLKIVCGIEPDVWTQPVCMYAAGTSQLLSSAGVSPGRLPQPS